MIAFLIDLRTQIIISACAHVRLFIPLYITMKLFVSFVHFTFFLDAVIATILIFFSFNTLPSSSSLANPLTFQVAYLVIFCFLPFSLNRFLAILRRQFCRPVGFVLRPESNT
jgi:hypothetical protein